jgi:hypothetical protein
LYYLDFHYDGEIVSTDHKVDVRTLGKTLTHLQRSIDRAYLDIKRGGVYKHARIRKDEFDDALFWVGNPRIGGFRLKSYSETEFARKITNRISEALKPAFDDACREGFDRAAQIKEQIERRKGALNAGSQELLTFDQAQITQEKGIIRDYGDRSIVKEYDEILSILRSSESGKSFFDLKVKGDKTLNFNFDKKISEKFHIIVTNKIVGNPVLYKGLIRSLDVQTLTGKFINSFTKKTHVLKTADKNDVIKIRPFLGEDNIQFVGCPIIEYGSYDLNAGDIYFIDLIK